MKPNFADLIKAVISMGVVGCFLFLAVRNNDLKDALIAGFSSALGYWIGSSSHTQEKP
jgi:hypothetical protein